MMSTRQCQDAEKTMKITIMRLEFRYKVAESREKHAETYGGRDIKIQTYIDR